MGLYISIALGIVLGELGKELLYRIQNAWWSFRHRKDVKSTSTLDRLLFGSKFEEEELLEK